MAIKIVPNNRRQLEYLRQRRQHSMEMKGSLWHWKDLGGNHGVPIFQLHD